jgi:hypothetical protein
MRNQKPEAENENENASEMPSERRPMQAEASLYNLT